MTCDYNPDDHTHQIETLHDADLKPEGIIFEVFYYPERGEDDFNLTYEKKDWVTQC